jgi:1-acyl-sn-glycerol-3-phosphate acyltransferase
MHRLVSEAHSLIAFPEGTRSVDGAVGRFKRGTFLVAIEAQLPVVPVSLSGSRQVMRKGRLMVCPGDVRLTVHAPIPTRGMTREHLSELAERSRAVVRSGVDERTSDASESHERSGVSGSPRASV